MGRGLYVQSTVQPKGRGVVGDRLILGQDSMALVVADGSLSWHGHVPPVSV